MKLRTRLNLIVAGLTATFVVVLIFAGNRKYPLVGQRRGRGREPGGFPAPGAPGEHLFPRGRFPDGAAVPAAARAMSGRTRSCFAHPPARCCIDRPRATYKAGREAPAVVCAPAGAADRAAHILPAGRRSIDRAGQCLPGHPGCLGRPPAPLPDRRAHAGGGERAGLLARQAGTCAISGHCDGPAAPGGGDLAFRLPDLAGFEAHTIGAAFNRMAQAVQDKVQAER